MDPLVGLATDARGRPATFVTGRAAAGVARDLAGGRARGDAPTRHGGGGLVTAVGSVAVAGLDESFQGWIVPS